MDSSICVKPVHKPNSKIFSIPDEHSLHCNDRVDPNDPSIHIANTNTRNDIVLQKKIRKRNNKFDKPEVRQISLNFQNELRYFRNSDPAKQGKEVFDSGEIKELSKTWEKEAVIRDSKRGLVRVSSGRPVYWSTSLGKWTDIPDEDWRNWK
jgi:hypothetical protein